MEEFILSHGSYVAVFVLLALTGAGLPLPEEIIIVAAGVLSSPSVGKIDPFLALLACLAGALAGDCLMYGIGRLLGQRFLKRHHFFSRLIHAEREQQMESIVQQHGIKVFMLARFLVGVRSPIYVAMGVTHIDFRRFVLCDAICAAVVVSAFFWLSYVFGGWIGERLHQSQLVITIVVIVAAVFGSLYYLIWKRCREQLHLDEPTEQETADATSIS